MEHAIPLHTDYTIFSFKPLERLKTRAYRPNTWYVTQDKLGIPFWTLSLYYRIAPLAKHNCRTIGEENYTTRDNYLTLKSIKNMLLQNIIKFNGPKNNNL